MYPRSLDFDVVSALAQAVAVHNTARRLACTARGRPAGTLPAAWPALAMAGRPARCRTAQPASRTAEPL